MRITKEEWVKIRNEEELPLRVFWSYFDDMKPGKVTLQQFEQSFPRYAAQYHAIPYPNTKGQPCTFNMETTIKKMYDHFDKKFEV